LKLRIEFAEAEVRPPPPKDRRSVEARQSSTGGVGIGSTLMGNSQTLSKKKSFHSTEPDEYVSFGQTSSPPTLARERNRLTLRAYLNSLLSNSALASSDIMRDFLLQNPTKLTEAEMMDVISREEMDAIREEELREFREEVEKRVKELEMSLRTFREELVKRGERF
jgi:hypothetical protein